MDSALVPGAHVDLTLAIDHGQFAVLDRDAIIDVDAYTPEAQAAGLAQFSGGIVFFTESHWTTSTPLRLHVLATQPDVAPEAREHVVSGGVVCASGALRIFSPEETGANERALTIAAGTYGVVLCGEGFGCTDEYGDNGTDRYELWLWPTSHLKQPECVKHGLPDQ